MIKMQVILSCDHEGCTEEATATAEIVQKKNSGNYKIADVTLPLGWGYQGRWSSRTESRYSELLCPAHGEKLEPRPEPRQIGPHTRIIG